MIVPTRPKSFRFFGSPKKKTYKKPKLASKGWGPWRYEWYSICSGHGAFTVNRDCERCMTGSWRNVWLGKIEHIIYVITPGLWRWWVNRPAGKKDFLASFKKFDG